MAERTTLTTEFLPFHKPDIGAAEIEAVVETLRSGWLTTGAKVKTFEADFARYLGCSHAVAVNSGTAALHLSLEAVGVKEGDEVIVPTMTFTATAEVVLYLRAKPVLVDCLPGTLNIDPGGIERAITARTKAIIPVHFGGQPCDMEAIMEIARRRGIYVVEDAAHALPAKYQGRMIGTIGDITCFSFYATKTITTGEGGMVTTNNPELADKIRMLRMHGERIKYHHEVTGLNSRLDSLQAAVLSVKLKYLDTWCDRRAGPPTPPRWARGWRYRGLYGPALFGAVLAFNLAVTAGAQAPALRITSPASDAVGEAAEHVQLASGRGQREGAAAEGLVIG